MILADKIIALRKKAGWSQEQLAEQLGISRQSVSKWESGMSVPDLDKIVKMSGLFGVSTDYLLKDEIEEIQPSETAERDDCDCRLVTVEEANTYMDMIKGIANKMALAISWLVLCPIPLILLGAYSELENSQITEDMAGGMGVSILLVMAIFGIAPLIVFGMRLSKYEYLDKEVISLQYGVKGIVEKKKEDFSASYSSSVVIGVALCIAGVIPLMIAGGMEASDFVCVCCLSLLLLCVSVAVYFFVSKGMIQGSYNKLLQEGDYEVGKKTKNRIAEAVSGIYWCVTIAIYLGYSFVTNDWKMSWIIWPVAGVLYAAVMCVVNLCTKENVSVH